MENPFFYVYRYGMVAMFESEDFQIMFQLLSS